MPEERDSCLTPNQVSKRYGVGVHKVLGWIERGELAAINVASDTGRRPRWIVLPEALADFERRRSALPEQRQTRRRRKSQPSDVIEFY